MPSTGDGGDPGRVISWRHIDPLSENTRYRKVGRRLAPLAARKFPRRFGVFEIAALGSLEWLRRHLAIINELERIRRDEGTESLNVLDFGGADGSLGRAIRLYNLERHYRIVTADIEEPGSGVAEAAPYVGYVVLDPAGDLPMAPDTFDVAVSSDVFEHIPAPARPHWAAELGRVARLGQVHSVPADSTDGRWASTETDREFAGWYETAFGVEERWTTEHLAIGAPSIEELRVVFPGASIGPIVSTRVWLLTMKAKYGRKGPLDRVRFAATYLRDYRGIELRPPFKNALIVLLR